MADFRRLKETLVGRDDTAPTAGRRAEPDGDGVLTAEPASHLELALLANVVGSLAPLR